MKKVSNFSILLGLSVLATATGVNAETVKQSQVQSQSPTVSTLQSSLPATEVKLNDSETIRAINTELNRPKQEVAQSVTSVSELSDVRPTDWAFTALQSLIERYSISLGYPDRTFRGKQALSRYEFASTLNTALDKVNEIISSGLADKVGKEDLATLKKLQEEFAAELTTLRGRADALDAKTTKLEEQQFSTTTKLSGLAFFNVTGGSGSNVTKQTAAGANVLGNAPNTTMSGLVWLTLNTSFTGKDSLITQLAAGNGNSAYSNAYGSSSFFNTTATTFTDQTAGADANVFVLRELSYTFPVFEKATLVVGPRVNFYKYFDGNRFIYPWNTTFASINNSLLSDAKRGAGAVFMTPFGNLFDFKVGYLAESNEFFKSNSASSPTQGLTGGTNNLTAEIGFKPSDAFKLRLIYSHGNITGNGGVVGGSPSLQALTQPLFVNGQSDIFAANFDWLVSKGFGLFGRYGYGTTNLNRIGGGSASVNQYTFQIGAAFPDLFKEGAQAMVSFGVPYKFGDSSNVIASGRGNDGTQSDLEFSYIYPVTKNITFVPSAYFIFNPNNFSGNPTVFIGNLQAVFSF